MSLPHPLQPTAVTQADQLLADFAGITLEEIDVDAARREDAERQRQGSPASGGPGNGSLTDFQTGSFFRAGYGPSDFTLVELDDDPDPGGAGPMAIDHFSTAVTIYDFPFDSDPGWTTQGQWAFGVPTGGGSGNGDPTSGNTGSKVYGYNLDGDYPNNMGSTEYLTTSVLDLSGVSSTRLFFYQWLGVESADFDHANIQLSNDGSSWVTVWEHTATSAIDDSGWLPRTISISAIADGEPTVFIRWGMGPTDGSVTFAGWNIDDVQIWGVPVETDCNDNGTLDDEDIALGTSLDCNGNGRPDECDIADRRSADCDGDGVPDECTCPIADAPVAAVGAVATNRYLSMSNPNAVCQTALRVTFDSLPGSFAILNGQAMWVGEPHLSCQNAAQAVPPAGGCGPAPGLASRTLAVASLQCMPFYTDWSAWGEVHVFHEVAVVPDGTYSIQAIAVSCDRAFDSAYSDRLLLTTSIWGDLVENCSTTPCGPPDGSVDVTTDVVGILDRFRNFPGAPVKVRCDLEPKLPDQVISILDVTVAIDAFRGIGYPYPPGFSGDFVCK